jgi:hypothetical protein
MRWSACDRDKLEQMSAEKRRRAAFDTLIIAAVLNCDAR